MSASRDFRDLGGADPWKLLGVGRDAGAEEIKRSYRRLSRNHHTDLGGNADQQARLNRAYEILSDPNRSAGYALLLHRKSQPPPTRKPEPDPEADPTPDPFQWTSGPAPGYPPPRPHPQAAPRENTAPPYRDPYTAPRYDDTYEDPHKAPPYRDPYTAPRYADIHYEHPPARRGLSGQAVAALLTVFLCQPVSIILAIKALRTIRHTRQRGKFLAWLALFLDLTVIAFTIYGRILTTT